MKTFYFGGTVLPLDGTSTASGLIVEDGKIPAVGKQADLESLAKDACQVDLEGRTLMPAFIDGHSHITRGCRISEKFLPV